MTGKNFHFWGAVSVVLLGFWLLLFTYSIHSAMPLNPINLPLSGAISANVFMPQGWKFFTRNPREDDIKIFRKNNEGNWVSATFGANSSPVNLFGIKRTARSQGIEIGLLMASIKKDEWVECKGRTDVCMEQAATNKTIVNESPLPTICGEVAFVMQPPVPWAWSRAKREVVMPSKLIKVGVVCS